MRIGNNLSAKITRWIYINDDSVGGAKPSGIVIYENVQVRMQDAPPIVDYAVQGVEVNKIHQAFVYPGTLNIREYDQFEAVSPPNHPYIGLVMRIDTVQKPNFHPADPRGYLLLTMTRANKHNNEYQA